MNKYLKLIYALVFLLSLQSLIACKKKTDQPAQEAEKITSVRLDLLADQKGKQDVSVAFKDAGGINGKQSSSPLRLQENTTYTAKVTLLNESTTPATDVSVAYNTSFQVTGASLAITKLDRQITFKTGAATTGTDALLRIEMKQNTNVQNVSFPVLISQ